MRALKLLELVHAKYGVKPDTDTFRLLCINLAKSVSPVAAERAWLLATKVYNKTPNPLYCRESGYRLDGPCLALWRSRWLIQARRMDILQTHMRESHKQIEEFVTVQSNRTKVSHTSQLLLFYASVVRTAAPVDVDISILYLRLMLELPGARQDSLSAANTINFVLDNVLAEGRTVRAAALVQELETFRVNKQNKDRGRVAFNDLSGQIDHVDEYEWSP